jgi:hypothetical protein
MHDRHDRHDRHVRTTIPAGWSRQLAHLAADLGVPQNVLLREAVILLLNHHGLGGGLPEPRAPFTAAQPVVAEAAP